MHKIFTTLLGLFVSLQTLAQLEVPPKLKWKTMLTPHFEIIYNAEQQDLGVLYAEKLESAYEKLAPYFRIMPERTIVVINDKTDVTNGYATRIPYPHIMVYPVLPGPQESLADPGDWAFELLAHEYVHILTFEPAEGIMQPLRVVFGNIIAPNLLLPRWWKEGLAVEMETRLSNHGRLRSIYQDAAIRAWAASDKVYNFDLAEINEIIPTWPEGMRPYLFGSLMWSEMLAKHGREVVNNLTLRHGQRVPFFVEQPARDYLGDTYPKIYEKAVSEIQSLASTQIELLKKVPPTTYTLPKNNFLSVVSPTISPDGHHMAVITEDDSGSRAVKVLTRKSTDQSFLDVKMADTVERLNEASLPTLQNDGPPTGSIQRISWFPDSQKIVYDKIDITNRIERFSDLYTYDLKFKKTETLTQGLRAREPAVSPSGENIAFVRLEGGKTYLALLSQQKGSRSAQDLYYPGMQGRISSPSFITEDLIVFSLRDHQGSEFLFTYEISTQKVTKVLSDHPNARFAKMTSEGLLFSSSKNGTYNIYLANSDLTQAHPLTHTITANFSADLDPHLKELFVTAMTTDGQKVVSIKAKDYKGTARTLPQISPLLSERYPAQEIPVANYKLQPGEYTVSDYSPYGYLWPQYWMPFISGSSSETGLVLQAQTSGFDPLKKHSYTLLGSWDTALNQGSLLGTYLNHVTELPVAFTSYSNTSYLGNIDNDFRDLAAILAALPDMHWLSKYASLQIGWQYFERKNDVRTLKRMGPQVYLSYSDYSQAGAQISPESGKHFHLGLYKFLPQEGYTEHSQITAGTTVYFSKFLPKHHAVMLKMNGVYTPEKIPTTFGVSTLPLMYTPDSVLPEYVMRGYSTGQFIGKNLLNLNAEYRLPLRDIYAGSGTDPFFLRRFVGALTADGVATDGFFINEISGAAQTVSMKRQFWSVGAELKAETTLAYAFPVNFVVGYYVALNASEGSQGSLGTTLQVSGF